MPELARNTIIQYRSRLRTLKAALEAGILEGEDLQLAAKQVAELEAKLGSNVVPERRQGRPKKWIKLTAADVERLKEGKPLTTDWSQEAIDKRAREVVERYKTKEQTEEKSSNDLNQIIEMTGDEGKAPTT